MDDAENEMPVENKWFPSLSIQLIFTVLQRSERKQPISLKHLFPFVSILCSLLFNIYPRRFTRYRFRPEWHDRNVVLRRTPLLRHILPFQVAARTSFCKYHKNHISLKDDLTFLSNSVPDC